MKKITTLLLAMVLILSFSACGKESDSNTSTKKEKTSNTSGKKEDKENSGNTQKEKKEISFQEVVAVDNDQCTIKITEIDPDNMWGFTLKAQLENKSTDKSYTFSVSNVSVNGVMTDPLFATEVAAGKKSNSDISFIDDSLEKNGVGDYTDIELTFRVYDSNDWLADDVAKETIHIYPYGEDNAVEFVRKPKDSDTVLVDNDSVTVILLGYEDDEIWGYSAKLFLLNKTDKNVMFSADDVSVNGFMADPLFATSVGAGKCAFKSMSWLDDTLKENGITKIEEIAFKLLASDADDWLSDNFVEEAITLNP